MGFFQLTGKKWLLISQPLQGEDSGSFTFCQGKLWLHRPGGKSQESKGEHTSPRENRLSPSPRLMERQGLLEAAWRKGVPPSPPASAPPHPRSTRSLIVFHFLIITLLLHPKPNTETLPSIYQAPTRAIKVSAICYSLPCF